MLAFIGLVTIVFGLTMMFGAMASPTFWVSGFFGPRYRP
jgi:hypothetical protein